MNAQNKAYLDESRSIYDWLLQTVDSKSYAFTSIINKFDIERLHRILKEEFVPSYPAPVPDTHDVMGKYTFILDVYRQYDIYERNSMAQETITITM